MSTPGPSEKPASPVLRRVLDRFRREDDHSSPTKPAALSLRLGMHRLWTDHVIWTREYVVAAIAGTPDANAVAGRLMRKQERIGGAIAPTE